MMIRNLCGAFTVVTLACALSGCATDESDGGLTGDDQNITNATPLTIGNWLNHPRIKQVREEVGDITTSASSLKKRDNAEPKCDSFTTKFIDADAHIRKVNYIVTDGPDGPSGFHAFTEEAFYRTNGKLLFIFTTSGDKTTIEENRVYYDNDGKVFWQVARSGERRTISRVAEKAVKGDDRFMGDIEKNAKSNFDDNGCFEQGD